MRSLSPRLALCADFVRPGARLCDVGCDHGLLPCALAAQGKIASALAVDIRPGPLQAARRTVEAEGVGKLVSLRLSDGLQSVRPEEATDLVLAGMGGELILSVLAAAPWLKNPACRLILQPMTHADRLRQWLCENGFFIEKEAVAWEEQRGYVVLQAAWDGKVRPCSALFAAAGLVRDERYLENLSKKHFRTAAALEQSGRDGSEKRKLAQEILKLKKERGV